jgi:uncharacterized protein YndB with AHSA1/START domain
MNERGEPTPGAAEPLAGGGRIGSATEAFVAHRNLLFTVAYEMLGSAADAEDVLQETWLRWLKVDMGSAPRRSAPDRRTPPAWTTPRAAGPTENPTQEFTAMPHYRVSATTSAPVATVWGLLIDGRSWPQWSSGLDELVEARSTGLDPGGRDTVGTVRAFRTGRVVTGERLTELVGGRRIAYEDAFNFSIKDYRAVVDLEPTAAGGTTITTPSHVLLSGLPV